MVCKQILFLHSSIKELQYFKTVPILSIETYDMSNIKLLHKIELIEKVSNNDMLSFPL